jgi:hypothetical protein
LCERGQRPLAQIEQGHLVAGAGDIVRQFATDQAGADDHDFF